MIQILSNLYDARYKVLIGEGHSPLVAHTEALSQAFSRAHAIIDDCANTVRDITLERRETAGGF